MSTPEQVAQAKILIRFGAIPDLRIWRANTGKAWQPLTSEARAAFENLRARMPGGFRPVVYGTPGQPDVGGILTVKAPGSWSGDREIGRSVGIEVKAERGRLSPEQEAWRDMFVKRGGLWILAKGEHGGDDVAAALDAARRGER